MSAPGIPSAPLSDAALDAALKKWFNLERFRDGQREAIRECLNGNDVMLIMPTGMGKSLCFQLPALLLPHTTLVISPLIALMKDQVDALERRNIPATFLNSSVSQDEMSERLAKLRAGAYKLVYIAPERFRNERFKLALQGTRVSLLTVDEAHCISQWGHDFRPDYLNIKNVLHLFPEARLMAVTATATPDVRDDITAQLGMGRPPRNPPAVHVHGFSRNNLHLSVIRAPTHDFKLHRVQKLIEHHRNGIIYVATRKQAERVQQKLMAREKSVNVLLYHGALSDDERTRVQEAFVAAPHAVIVATNAFGMGVDRSDLRFIAHWDLPGSVEAYYQEVGRAGRDGLPAYCELLFNYADVRTQQFFIDSANPTYEDAIALLNAIRRKTATEPQVLTGEEWSELAGIKNAMQARTILGILERADLITRTAVPGQRSNAIAAIPDADMDALQTIMESREKKQERDNQRLKAMLRFVDSAGCRHRFILSYFGETSAMTCGGCDACGPAKTARTVPLTEEQWLVIQKLLSCIGRMKGQYGARRVIQVVRGEPDPALKERGLTELSTYGLLSDVPEKLLQALIDILIQEAVINVSNDDYRMLALSDRGLRVVHRKEPNFMFPWPALTAPEKRRKTKPTH
jgi:ATP-dependent DNA helicase RecQ